MRAAQIGLTFVKKQFLPRSGILYEDLANLLKTQFINPNLPTAKSLVTMESIKFSYMFLKSLIDHNAKTMKDKFKQMLAFLDNPTAPPTVGDTLKQLLAADQERSEFTKRLWSQQPCKGLRLQGTLEAAPLDLQSTSRRLAAQLPSSQEKARGCLRRQI
jgi:hypothetical protein